MLEAVRGYSPCIKSLFKKETFKRPHAKLLPASRPLHLLFLGPNALSLILAWLVPLMTQISTQMLFPHRNSPEYLTKQCTFVEQQLQGMFHREVLCEWKTEVL